MRFLNAYGSFYYLLVELHIRVLVMGIIFLSAVCMPTLGFYSYRYSDRLLVGWQNIFGKTYRIVIKESDWSVSSLISISIDHLSCWLCQENVIAFTLMAIIFWACLNLVEIKTLVYTECFLNHINIINRNLYYLEHI
jgi:hypothetical protein